MQKFNISKMDTKKSKTSLKEEYSNKLNKVNQKINPEEFIKLEEEYKCYLFSYLDNISNKEVSKCLERIKVVYESFISRNDVEIWSEILKEDVCNCIETKDEVRDLLMIILMKDYYISQNILKLFDDKFKLIENKAELYEKFPSKFVDKLISNINKKEYPLYEFFEIKEGLDYDTFLKLFYELDYCVKNDEFKRIKILLKKLKDLNIKHPQLDVNKYTFYLKNQNLIKCKIMLSNLKKQYGYLTDVKIVEGDTYLFNGKYKLASEVFESVIKSEPTNISVLDALATSYIEQGKTIEAREPIEYLLLIGYIPENDERVMRVNWDNSKNKCNTIFKNRDLYNELESILHQIELLCNSKQYEQTILACDDALMKYDYILIYQYKIQALYNLGRFVEAYNVCNEALGKTKYILFMYMYKIRILIEWNRIDEAKMIIKSLKSREIKKDLRAKKIKIYDFRYFEALILEKSGKVEESKKIISKLSKKLSSKDIEFIFKDELFEKMQIY